MLFKLISILHTGSSILADLFSSSIMIVVFGIYIAIAMHFAAQIVFVYNTSSFKRTFAYKIAIIGHYVMWAKIISSNLHNNSFLDALIAGSIIVFLITNSIIDLRDVFQLNANERKKLPSLFNGILAFFAVASGLLLSSKIIFTLLRNFFSLILTYLSK